MGLPKSGMGLAEMHRHNIHWCWGPADSKNPQNGGRAIFFPSENRTKHKTAYPRRSTHSPSAFPASSSSTPHDPIASLRDRDRPWRRHHRTSRTGRSRWSAAAMPIWSPCCRCWTCGRWTPRTMPTSGTAWCSPTASTSSLPCSPPRWTPSSSPAASRRAPSSNSPSSSAISSRTASIYIYISKYLLGFMLCLFTDSWLFYCWSMGFILNASFPIFASIDCILFFFFAPICVNVTIHWNLSSLYCTTWWLSDASFVLLLFHCRMCLRMCFTVFFKLCWCWSYELWQLELSLVR